MALSCRFIISLIYTVERMSHADIDARFDESALQFAEHGYFGCKDVSGVTHAFGCCC